MIFRPVAFESRIPFPGTGRMDTYREHRLVRDLTRLRVPKANSLA